MLQSKICQVGVVIFDPVKAFILNKWEASYYTNFAPPPPTPQNYAYGKVQKRERWKKYIFLWVRLGYQGLG